MRLSRETSVRISKYYQDTHEFTVTITGEPLDVIKVLSELGGLTLVSYNYQDWIPKVQSFDKTVKEEEQ